TTAAVVVVLVHLEVLGEVGDPLGQDRDLHLGRTGVALDGRVLLADLGFGFLVERHFLPVLLGSDRDPGDRAGRGNLAPTASCRQRDSASDSSAVPARFPAPAGRSNEGRALGGRRGQPRACRVCATSSVIWATSGSMPSYRRISRSWTTKSSARRSP